MNRYSYLYILAFSFTLALSSCNDWLDVSPDSEIEEEDQFNRESGFRDQLTGVYTAMCQEEMYGLNMGIGFVEVLSHSYDVDASGIWRYADDYDYENTSSESIIEEIWSSTYSCIANLNIMLENLEEKDPSFFSDNNYYLCKGEGYGLRAFLHLELMRLFAQAPSMSTSANGVPYVTKYGTDIVTQKSVSETMDLIIADLLVAYEALQHDSLKIGESPYSQRSERVPYFNYYAACLTLARAYLWNGDTENALKYAQEIVDVVQSDVYSYPFSFVHYTSMTSSNMYEVDLRYSAEHIFRLVIDDWEDIGNYYFKSDGGTSALSPSETTAQDIYEITSGYGNDYRYLKGFEQDGENKYMCKFWYIDGGSHNDEYPLLRLTEAYYIAAECLKDSDPETAIDLLNEVRENRNLSLYPLDYSLSSDDIQNEIYKEYRKEFIGEAGQLFFYYKRLNASSITNSSVSPSKDVYVLPIPENDVEFGGYSN